MQNLTDINCIVTVQIQNCKIISLIDEQSTLIKPNMYLRVNLDLPL